ncbi:MAG: Hsp20/alpha crystallin family protein, partial [Bacteriovoracaceae bacterium]|nr:Hsp20/alpha crystallin family protein [Bacteriovoracaceae bacterium]
FESKETPESWLMSIEVPGVKDEDLEIEVEDKILSVKGIKYNPLDEDTKKEFTKNFRLPESVDLEAIEAKLNHGILVVTLPKRLEKRSRKIEISTSDSVQATGTISKDTETTVAQ